nr:hypothetical protein [Tanacetum cinerariifolium]
MPPATSGDTSLTRSYISKVSQTPGISPTIAHFYKPIKDRCIHEGRVVDQLYYTSDHINRGDDDEDDGTSRVSTPSPTTYLNSPKPLDYQKYDIPTSSEQDDDLLFECQTDLLNQTQQMHKELREKTDGEALINSIQNEKNTRKIDRLARSLLIQGLPNDIYSLIDSNKTAKDLWDALKRQMRGSEYAEQDRKAAILYEYETFKATEGEQLLDNYLRYLQVINDLKKCGYKKDNYINIDALYNILKQNQGDVNDALGYKKKGVVVTSDPLALVAEKTKVSKRKEKVEVQTESEGSDDDDISDLKKITALLAKAFNRKKVCEVSGKKEDKKADEKKRDKSNVKCYNCKKEGHFAKDCKKAKDQAWMESNSDSDQKINANMIFMAQIEKVLLDSDESSSSSEETIAEVAYYTSESESESEFKTSEYYDKSNNYGLFVNDNDDQEIFHDAIESASESVTKNHIDSQKDYDKSEVNHNDSKEKEHLVDKQTNQTIHMIMPSKDTLYNGQKGIGFENPSYFEKAKDLRPSLYDEKVIGLGYTPMFLIHSDEALEIEKFKKQERI